jgi:hypothetical protein
LVKIEKTYNKRKTYKITGKKEKRKGKRESNIEKR